MGRSARAPLAVSTNTPIAAGGIQHVDLELGLLGRYGDRPQFCDSRTTAPTSPTGWAPAMVAEQEFECGVRSGPRCSFCGTSTGPFSEIEGLFTVLICIPCLAVPSRRR